MKTLLLGIVALIGTAVGVDYLAPHATAHFLLGLERTRSGLAAKRLHPADVDIAYLEGGSGDPLVLVHGFGADKDNFTRIAADLTPHYRVVIPDLPGFGESSRPPDASYTIAQQVEWLRAFVAALGLGRVHLGGNSMGGFIVTEWALAHPDEVASLWLLAPAGTSVAFDSELTREMARTGRNPLLVQHPDDFPATMDYVMASRPFVPYSVRRTLADAAVASYPLHARIFEVVGPGRVPAVDDRLPGLKTPTLVVFGRGDRALNPEGAKVYERAMPDVEVVLMDDVGHLPMLQAPGQAAADYRAFRERLAKRS